MISPMWLDELLEGWVDDAPAVRISGLGIDSRKLRPGDAFVAVQGGTHHGAAFVGQAVASGCRAILTDGLADIGDCTVPVISIPDLGGKLGELGSRFFAAPSERLVLAGVTGTNGKTSVAHFLAQAWQRVYGQTGMIGTLGSGPLDNLAAADMTTPDALQLQNILARCADDGVEHLAMEVSSHALMQDRCQTVQFDAAIFTNLSRDHLDYHVDMKQYAAAKRLLFSEHAPGFSVINHDDSTGRQWISELDGKQQVMSYGLQDGAELQGRIVCRNADGMTIRLSGPWGDAEIQSGLFGAFNASNLLAAAATMTLLGMPWNLVVHELEMMRPVPGRMMRLGGEPGQPVVVVDYAHTPEALESALKGVRDHLHGKLVCVFGCGGNRDRGKRPQMGRAAEMLADSLIITSDNPRDEGVDDIIADVLAGLEHADRVMVEPDRAAAIRRAIAGCSADDIVLVAGKGHESWQEVGGRRIPFSDEATVRAALEEAA
jgi:UDP-N-acetylmuramoyl-L-alanyl-D-glutamate--2,6-diaminopimelate ligase